MWMCYSRENWPKADSLVNAVKRLQCMVEELSFEAGNEYNRSCASDPSLLDLEQKYNRISSYCELVLSGGISIEEFLQNMVESAYEDWLCEIIPHLPNELFEKYRVYMD